MANDLFRKEVIEKITAPGGLNSYVRVLKPSTWLILTGIVIALAGLIFFTVSTGFPVLELFFGHFSSEN
ncbi:MAG: hypothetical protein LBU88_01315 [Treponema sp.]|nr:hypothetical protein [Treponema sp.]